MLSLSRIRSTLLALAWGAVAGTAQAAATLSVSPNPAPAERAFTLYLQGAGGNCYTTFARESVLVTGNRIDLRYTSLSTQADRVDTLRAPCPIYLPQDVKPLPYDIPAFAMPSLKAGKYEVWATQVPVCMLEQPGCLMVMPSPVSAGTLQVVQDSLPDFTFTPSSASAGQAFELHLLSYRYNCGTLYDSLSAVVADGAITLYFSARQNPLILCPAVYMPYGPVFKMPALKAGSYKVKVSVLGANSTLDAGVLAVTDGAVRKGWYLKQDTQAPGKAFTLQLLRDDIGNCQTSFSDQTLTVSSQRILLGFAMQQHPERVCVQNVKPYGPSFEMPALSAGIYPVSAAVCNGEPALCKLDPMVASVVDTLLVANALAVRMSDLRRTAPSAELKGRVANLLLPEGKAGMWRAELMSLDGRVLAVSMLNGSAGQKVSLPVGAATANAAGLVRLTSPDGKQNFFPIVR